MKTKITLHTPVFILLTRTENFEIKTPKYWNDLLQNMIFLIQKMVSVYPFFNRSRTKNRFDTYEGRSIDQSYTTLNIPKNSQK
jgi:hypothetical protein